MQCVETSHVWEPLTEREQEILDVLVTRQSYREIAQQLFISVNTVKTHVSRVYMKLGATSRKEALERARAADIVTLS